MIKLAAKIIKWICMLFSTAFCLFDIYFKFYIVYFSIQVEIGIDYKQPRWTMEPQTSFEIPGLKESMSIIFKALIFLKKKKKVYRFIPINTSEPFLKIFNPLSICVDCKHRHTHAHPLSKKLLRSQLIKCLSLREFILSLGISLVVVISFSDFWPQNWQRHYNSKNLFCGLFLWLRNLNRFRING